MAEVRVIPPSEHSEYGASSAHRWAVCAGSWVLAKDARRQDPSKPASEGTVCHFIAAECRATGAEPQGYIGDVFKADGLHVTVTRDMIDNVVQVYLDNLKEYESAGDPEVQIEVSVDYSASLGVEKGKAWGTADALMLYANEIGVHDLKSGRGEEVDADDNVQMSLYAIGALDQLGDLMGYDSSTKVALVIHQPRIRKAPLEWATTVGELREKAAELKKAVHMTKAAMWAYIGWKNDGRPAAGWKEFEDKYLVPGEKQCRWCPVKGTCSKAREEVAKTVFNADPVDPDEFKSIKFVPRDHIKPSTNDWLAAALAQAPFIESWLKAVRAEADARLLAGQQIAGFKVVMGRQGDRTWVDEEAVAAELKSMRLRDDQIYSKKLISPAGAEALTKGKEPVVGERQWKKLQSLIQRTDGKPSVAPESDSRQAITVAPVEEEFDDLTQSIADELG